MIRTICKAYLTGGRMQLALEVLPGFKLQFIGGVAHVVDQGNPQANRAMMMKVLQTPDIIVEPTNRAELGWEDWFPAWMNAVREQGRAVTADVRMPSPVEEAVRTVKPGDVNYSLLHPIELIPLVVSQEEVETRRVESLVGEVVVSETVVVGAETAEPAKPISWDEALAPMVASAKAIDDYIADANSPATPTIEEIAERAGVTLVAKPRGHKAEGCRCNPCIKRARQIEALVVTA